MAPEAYKRMLVESDMDDVMLTQAFTGLDTNMLTPSMIAAGLDPRTLPPRVSIEEAARNFGSKGEMNGPRRYKDIWSAGHSVSGVDARTKRGGTHRADDSRIRGSARAHARDAVKPLVSEMVRGTDTLDTAIANDFWRP